MKQRILIIDDDIVDQMAIERAIKNGGLENPFEIVKASEPDAARKLLTSGRFDLVFLDYLLSGGVTGVDFLREIRGMKIHAPVIVVTSQGDEKIAVEVMKAGGTDYVSKNEINAASVTRVVTQALRQNQAEEEKARAQKALQESEARLAEAQRIAHMGSWQVDLQTLNFTWSDELFRLLGYGVGEVQPSFDLYLKHIHPDYKHKAREQVEKILQEGKPFIFHLQFLTRRNELLDVEIHGSPVRDESGKITSLLGTFQDISERKRFEKELIAAKELAEKSARARQDFLASMSHEIRTPLNAILGFTKLLLDTTLTAEQRESLRTIDTAGEALLGIINDVLDFSKIESGKFTFEYRDYNLRQLLTAMLEMFRLKAAAAGIRLQLSIDPGVPEDLRGDSLRLNQVVLNLVSNAVKFSERGTVEVKVKKSGEIPGGLMLRFEVSDEGIGIPEDKQAAVFESFFQAGTEIARKYGGTGLGLAICKRLVNLMGGEIGVTSQPGKGSTFYFSLPVEFAHGLPDAEHVLQMDEFPGFDAGRVRVLVVEDNALNRKLVTRVLDKYNFQWKVAVSGREALQLLAAESFDVVLMDIQMDGEDGIETTRRLRRDFPEPVSTIPVIALTAHSLREEMEAALSAGMNDFMTKPFLPEALCQKIAKWVKPSGQSVPAIDPRLLEEMSAGDYSFKSELISIFLSETPRLLEEASAFLVNFSAEDFYRKIHTLKPGIEMFGIAGAGDLARSLERLVKEGANAETLRPVFSQFEKCVRDAFPQINRL